MRKIFIYIFAAVLLPFEGALAEDTLAPSVAYVYPAGARAGCKTRVVLGGINLGDAREVIVSGGGVKASIGGRILPLRQGEVPSLRFKLEKIFLKEHPEVEAKMKELGAEGQAYLRREMMKIEENRRLMAEADASYYLRVVSTDALAETLEVEIEVEPDAKPGMRQIVLRTASGLSIPKNFAISDLPEVAKPSLRQTLIERAKSPEYKGGAAAMGRKKFAGKDPETRLVDLPCVVNGQITEGRVDTCAFELKKGEKVWIAAAARSLIPYISDAVPGWFQIVLRVFDEEKKEVAYNDDCYYLPDSHLSFEAPKDGKYLLEIRDAIYRHREDFVYRITLSKNPITPIPEIFAMPPKPPRCAVFEKGAIAAKGAQKKYARQMKKGEKFVAEVFARRCNSPLDSLLCVAAEDGKILAVSDDYTDETCGLITHHADSRLEFAAPEDGKYTFAVSDSANGFSEHHKFAFALSRPSAGFKIVSYNSTANARRDSIAAYKLKIFRSGGAKFPITLEADLPEGWRLLNPKIPPNAAEHELLIKTKGGFGSRGLEIAAKAKIGKAEISGRVRPADYLMQAFYYRHFVPADAFLCAEVENEKPLLRFRDVACDVGHLSKGVGVPMGGYATIRYARAKNKDSGKIVPSVESDIFKVLKHYFYKGHLYAAIAPTEKAKPGMRQTLHLNLSVKIGKKVYAFDKTAPVAFTVKPAAKPPESAAGKPENKQPEKPNGNGAGKKTQS